MHNWINYKMKNKIEYETEYQFIIKNTIMCVGMYDDKYKEPVIIHTLPEFENLLKLLKIKYKLKIVK